MPLLYKGDTSVYALDEIKVYNDKCRRQMKPLQTEQK